MSTELPLESVSCPNCGNVVTFRVNTPEWCPQCGAPLQEVSAVKSLRRNAFMALIGCVLTPLGMLGSCGLVIYGTWRFSQTHVGALVLSALAVFLVVAHVVAIIRQLSRKR